MNIRKCIRVRVWCRRLSKAARRGLPRGGVVRHVLISLAVAVFLAVADYFVGNMSFPVLDDDLGKLGVIGYFSRDRGVETDAFYVNMALDKQLVPVTDSVFGDTLGYMAVTDREKLLHFLQIASLSDYKYIFVDIRFERGISTESDEELFGLIASMPRIVVSTHRRTDDYEFVGGPLSTKVAYADYRTTFLSGFSRYEFLQNGCASVALQMYRDLCGGDIERHGIVYTSGGRLCNNMRFIPMDGVVPAGSYGPDGEIRYPYLSSQIMELYTETELLDMMRDRYVIIGDFDNDVHQTYIGNVPGASLSFEAYRVLAGGGHLVNWMCVAILAVINALVCLVVISDRKSAFLSRIKSPVVKFICTIVGWEAVFLVLKVLLFLVWGQSFIATVPSVVFTAICYCKKYRQCKT